MGHGAAEPAEGSDLRGQQREAPAGGGVSAAHPIPSTCFTCRCRAAGSGPPGEGQETAGAQHRSAQLDHVQGWVESQVRLGLGTRCCDNILPHP